jgi:hypothetical protein
MDCDHKRKTIYGAGEGCPSTGAVVCSQVGLPASSSHDYGRSGVDRQAPGGVFTSGEAGCSTEIHKEPPRRMTRASRRTTGGTDDVFLAPAEVTGLASVRALRTRMRSDGEDSVASFASRSSLGSTVSGGKRRRMMTLTPEISVDLALDIRTSSAADVSAEFTRQVSKILRVAAVSSSLKGASIKDIKYAATYVAAAWKELNLQRAEMVHSGSSTAARRAEARLTALEEENAALRKEITRLAARTHECPRCNDRAIESGHPPREGKQEGARLDALEKKMDELGPSIMRAIEERFGGRRPRSPELGARRTNPLPHASPKPQCPRGSRRVANGGWWKNGRGRKGPQGRRRKKRECLLLLRQDQRAHGRRTPH